MKQDSPSGFSRIIRKKEVRFLTGLSDATIWRYERDGAFPRRKQLGTNCVGWLERDIQEWIIARTNGGIHASS